MFLVSEDDFMISQILTESLLSGPVFMLFGFTLSYLSVLCLSRLVCHVSPYHIFQFCNIHVCYRSIQKWLLCCVFVVFVFENSFVDNWTRTSILVE